MKHLSAEDGTYLGALVAEAGMRISDVGLGLMMRHLDWVLDWNDRINLTSITAPREALRLHVLDSLMALESVRGARPGSLCDIGTGGGFPGVPLGLASGRDTWLLESVKKKARVLSGLVDGQPESEWRSFHVADDRAETHALTEPGHAVVCARAVAQLGSLIELSAPLLSQGGVLVALKGALSEEELGVGRDVAKLTGMEVVGISVQSLPEGGETRSIVTVARVGRSKVALPRRIGLAQRQPLA